MSTNFIKHLMRLSRGCSKTVNREEEYSTAFATSMLQATTTESREAWCGLAFRLATLSKSIGQATSAEHEDGDYVRSSRGDADSRYQSMAMKYERDPVHNPNPAHFERGGEGNDTPFGVYTINRKSIFSMPIDST